MVGIGVAATVVLMVAVATGPTKRSQYSGGLLAENCNGGIVAYAGGQC